MITHCETDSCRGCPGCSCKMPALIGQPGMVMYRNDCAESVSGRHSPLDSRGRCSWCGRKVGDARPMPRVPVSDLSLAYAEQFDPDWGSS